MMKKPSKCPSCDSTDIALILWGLPIWNSDLDSASEKREMVLGGCCVSNNDPKWECTNCSFRWGRRDAV
jgi:hypothetical protein